MDPSRWSAVAAAVLLVAVPPGAELRAQATENADSAATEPAPAAESIVPESAAARDAARAAEAWLRIVDAGDYEEAWGEASSVLQNSASPQVLKNAIRQGRSGLDSLVSRTLVAWEEVRNPPGAVPGQYVVLSYRTVGTEGWQVTETVIPRRDDGEWRVSGYMVKKE